MSRAGVWLVAGSLALGLALATFWVLARHGGEAAAPAADGEPAALAAASVTLYFPGRGDRLWPEIRELAAGSREERVAKIVAALVAGPEGEGLAAPLPPGAAAAAVFVSASGTAFLDLTAPEGLAAALGGSKRELLSVYALVNSVALNIDGIERVVLMWNGQQRATFAGHVDTTRPLAPDRAWIGSPS